MTASQTPNGRRRLVEGDQIEPPGYGPKYGLNYGLWVCSWEGPRPRQHWGFTACSSPTTRPPRGKLMGGCG